MWLIACKLWDKCVVSPLWDVHNCVSVNAVLSWGTCSVKIPRVVNLVQPGKLNSYKVLLVCYLFY